MAWSGSRPEKAGQRGSLLCDLRRLLGRLAGHFIHSDPAARCPLRHVAAYGSTNMYRPVSMSKASGNSGKKYTQEAGSFPNPKVMKMAMTIAVKAMDSQRWVCRIHMFQFNGTSSDDKPQRIGSAWRRPSLQPSLT